MGRNPVARGNASRAACALLCLACGCTSSAASSQGPKAAAPAQTPSASAGADGEIFAFAEATASPQSVAQVPSSLAPFFDQCRLGDAALARVAERFARRQSLGSAAFDVSEIGFA